MGAPCSGTGDRNLPAVPAGGGVSSKKGEPVLAAMLHPQEQLPEGMYWHPITPLQTHAALIKQQVHKLFNGFLPQC